MGTHNDLGFLNFFGFCFSEQRGRKVFLAFGLRIGTALQNTLEEKAVYREKPIK